MTANDVEPDETVRCDARVESLGCDNICEQFDSETGPASVDSLRCLERVIILS
jgi:hypothetical protein